MNYHAVPPSMAKRLFRQLQWVGSNFDIIDFADFNQRFTSTTQDRSKQRPSVLLTFDDGLRSHIEVVAPVLEDLGLLGVFFVVPGFAENKRHLSTDDIRQLHRSGHTIGCHTMNHASLDATDNNHLEKEIIESGKILEQCIGSSVDTFAWTYAWNRIRPRAWQMICESYKYCFTPCPGVVYPQYTDPCSLWRTNVEASYSKAHYRFMYSGLPSILWTNSRNLLIECKKKLIEKKTTPPIM